MERNNNNTKEKKWEQLSYKKRLMIEVMRKGKKRSTEIADESGDGERI